MAEDGKENRMAQMTKMQQRIYDYIARTIRDQGYPPSVREIGEAVGLKSPSTVHFHLKHMEEAGVLVKGAGKGRAIALAGGQETTKPVPAPELKPRFTEPEIPVGKVPVVGSVAAGAPILAQEVIEDYLTFDTGGRDGEYFALRVRGESMLYAGILPDDLVVVHQQQDARNGEIVVALLEDEATVKRLQRKGGETWLLPENPDYQPIDGRNATILGKVAAVIRTY
jgi:repressor LexA